MTSPVRSAIGDALSLLKSGDVMAATTAIQRSLGLGKAGDATPESAAKADVAGLKTLAQSLFGHAARLQPPGKASVRTLDRNDNLGVVEAARPSPVGKKANGDAEQGFSARKFHAASGSLDYKLYVPADHGNRDLALVMMLHGCTQNPDDFARGTQMNRLADEFGLIVAYPHQPRTANAQGCWNWFEARHQQRGSGEPAVLSALAQEIAREFKIAPDRTFVAGLSAGGAMADVLASTHPDVFAGAGIHSGLPHGAACDLVSAFGAMKGGPAVPRQSGQAGGGRAPAIRKIIFHGAADGTVNASNGLQILHQIRRDRRDVAEMTTDTTVNGRRVTRTTLDGPDGTALAEHWLVHGIGHAWSGGDQGGSFVEAAGPDASREMIRFFLQT
jgi:poly(hydroxyalkanoate) depolymerase family esterase